MESGAKRSKYVWPSVTSNGDRRIKVFFLKNVRVMLDPNVSVSHREKQTKVPASGLLESILSSASSNGREMIFVSRGNTICYVIGEWLGKYFRLKLKGFASLNDSGTLRAKSAFFNCEESRVWSDWIFLIAQFSVAKNNYFSWKFNSYAHFCVF